MFSLKNKIAVVTGDGGNARFHQADVVNQKNMTDLFAQIYDEKNI